jgi:hypothetical protein
MATANLTPYHFLIDEARGVAVGLSDAAALLEPGPLRERLTQGSHIILRLIHALRRASSLTVA